MRTAVSLLIASLALSGCASWSTYNKQRDFVDVGHSSMVFVDAKQRAVLSNIDPMSNLRRFCAEPSPDALSAIAATGGVNLSVAAKGELGYAQGFSEGAASIGLRTQSIQLLRDVMFSNCEAFINQGVTGFGLETMQRRFQSTLVAVMAIEQLTGATRAQQAGLAGQASTNNAEVLGTAIKLVADTDAAATAAKARQDADAATAVAAKADLEKFVAAHAGDTISADYLAAKGKSDAANVAVATSKQASADRSADLASAKAVRAAAATAGSSGGVNVLFTPDGGASKAASEAAVATSVASIVKDTLELGFGREVCTTMFGGMIDPHRQSDASARAPELKAACLTYLTEGPVTRQAATDRYRKETLAMERSAKLVEEVVHACVTGKMKQEDADKLLAALAPAKVPATLVVAEGPVNVPAGGLPVLKPFNSTITPGRPIQVFGTLAPAVAQIPEVVGR